MHPTIPILSFILCISSSAFAQDRVINTSGLGTAVGGALDPNRTPPPSLANAKIANDQARLTGDLTIHVTNSVGNGLSISYGHNYGSPTALGDPIAGPLGTSTSVVYPTDWAGRITIGKGFDTDGSKIEGSYLPLAELGYVPNVDISYVDGFTVPIVCSCLGEVIVGCSHDLFDSTETFGGPCADKGKDICYNPARGMNSGPATPFFAPCKGVAYTFPFDDGADKYCLANEIFCCVGSTCPPHPNQQSRELRKRTRIGGHEARSPADAVEN